MADAKGKYPNFLRWALTETGVEPSDLARAMDTAPQNVYRFRDEERELTKSWAERLSAHLPGIRAAELIFGPQGSHAPQRVRLYSPIKAGRFADAEVVQEDDDPSRTVIEDLPPGDWLAFEVVGDSMNMIAPEGFIVFVNRKEQELVHGYPYAVAVADELTFKRYKAPPPRLEPVSTNAKHDTIFLETNQPYRVVGRVERAVKNLV